MTWRPNVSQAIQRSANRSKWRHERRLQTTETSTQTFPGFKTKRSEICVSQGQSVIPEVSDTKLCSFCRGPELDPCIYDVSECSGISQGSACRIRCKVPYLGASSPAVCEARGLSGREGNLTFELPSCVVALEQEQVSCPNPTSIPTGYRQVQETGQWVCSSGYYGQALRQCTLLRRGASCVLEAIFSGCDPLVSCRAPEPASDYPEGLRADVPACGYDITGCENVQYGQSCQIGCREPFTGAAVTARCPATNIDPNQKLIYDLPQCQKICPSPPVPMGYALDFATDTWSCAPDYTGEALKSCEVDASCRREVRMVGCLRRMPCSAPNLDSCRYDWSSCGNMAAGTSCHIGCKAPYEGDSFPSMCPSNNSDATNPMQFEIPWCSLNCPDPLPLPDGYLRQGSTYKCAEGYTGFTERTCTVNPGDCSYQVSFRGCEQLVPCQALPELPPWPASGNRCELDASDCQRSVALRLSCEVKCREPYVGFPRRSTCPSRNTDPQRTVEFSQPVCAVASCPEPIPPGYTKTANGYVCAPGYGGEVLSSCTACGRLVLTGCETAIPCVPLVLEDSCRYNVSDCSSIGAGETCSITCGNAYEGEATVASCPADNIDQQGQLVAPLPQCSLFCTDPDPVPEGYDLFVDYLGRRELSCAAGFVGHASSDCRLLEGCRTELQLSGCVRLEPCLPLRLPHAERYDLTGCQRVMPGSSCTVSCRNPWAGGQVSVTCPANNVDPEQPLIIPEELRMDRFGVLYNALWPLKCNLRCDSVPEGYEKYSAGRWRCAPGYHGTVVKSCEPRGNCREALKLQGCSQLIPCTIPALDACRYDVTECGGFQRGSSCQVKCRAPYNGTATLVQCPVNNTVTSGGLIGELPDCVIEACADSVIPAAYEPVDAARGLWSCASGYTGDAVKHCVAERSGSGIMHQAQLEQYGLHQPSCTVRGYLDGCVVAEPCAELWIQDSCMFEAMCNAMVTSQGLMIPSLPAGEACEVRCKPPYRARSSLVQCPSTNTNTSAPSVWEPIICELACPDVQPPLGIEAVAETGAEDAWQCSEGYIGTASRTCRLLEGCTSETLFGGCDRLLPCRDFITDSCGVNASACASLEPGETCQITCGQGHVGGPFLAECPAGNTFFNRALVLTELPSCERMFITAECYEPGPWPEGYVRNGSQWICAEGYLGTPAETCAATATCGEPVQLSGCLRERACQTLTFDSCRYEAIGCSGLMGGEDCEVRCKAPAEGQAVLASCPDENVDPNQELVFELPVCTIPSCPYPDPVTNGYVVEPENETLGCAEKFAGSPEVVCIFTNDCSPLARLEGCNPLLPCVGPAELDQCKFSVNLCEDGPLEDVPGGNDGYVTVKPGGSCQLSCRGAFVGANTVGRCPLNNTDPFKRLDFDPPLDCDCPDDLEEWPQGYNQTGVVSNSGPEQEGEWYCEDGYGGTPQVSCDVLVGCVPLMVFDGCAPLQRCRPMNVSTSPCRFDVIACNRSLDGGENCEVFCRLPAVGEPVNATCPQDNTVPNQELMTADVDPVTLEVTYRSFQWPLCETPSFCPDPVPMTQGYNRSGVEGGPAETDYECDEGYSPTPRVKRTCVMSNSSAGAACQLDAVFEGCSPIVNCTGIDERTVDTCRYDISSCPATFEPGEVCEVTCREPFYTGGSSFAACPSDNTDPARQIVVAGGVGGSICAQACPEPSTVPLGYEKVNGQWQCSAGYLGTAVADCEVLSIFSSETRSAVCEARVSLSGCEQMASCLPPTLDLCIYDVTDCVNVLAGTNCSLRCRSPPYEGTPSNASCPNGNLDPMRVVDFLPPSCELRCPPPNQEDLPNGYNYTNGAFVCLEGWFGSPNAECITSEEDCTFGVSLTGCGQSSPCVGLNESSAAGSCFYDITPQACSAEDPTFPQANFGRGPGGSCQVSCRPPCSPQEGAQFYETLSCPASNLNAQLPLQGTLPQCSFDCDPIERQGGYSKGADGEWVCAENFAGEVVPLCWSGEVCQDQLMLTGCLPVLPCVAPVIETNFCNFNTSECDGVAAGGSCLVGCTAPYYLGNVRPAYCAGNNTDPNGPAELQVRPMCDWNPEETCPDPVNRPTGYAFENGTWLCAPGYAGDAVRSCALRRSGSQCIPEAVLSGCAALTPCIEPQTRNCRYNTTNAGNLTPGSIGLIFCNVPFDGVPTTAQCPWDNNQPGQEPIYTLPNCEAACPQAVGQPTPPGFEWVEAEKEWICSEGYRSPAQVNCTTNVACEWLLDYQGCEKLEPCGELNISSCSVDTSACSDLQGGSSCELSCIGPFFIGESTVGLCPEGNIVPGRELDYVLPMCQVTCPDPAPPEGYIFTGEWQCAAGYAGTAKKSCHTTSYEEGCNTTTVLSGCLPIVPCKDPDPRTQPPCFYDTSSCSAVSAGTSCSVPCLAPYTGTPGRASCMANNTDPFRPLVWHWPDCSLDPCPDPAVLPAGYVKDTGGNWSCADEYVGTASISCIASPIEAGPGVQCNVTSVLDGCLGKVPCSPLPLDACMLDASNCSEGIPAGSYCEVLCKYPYTGVPGEASCPEVNTERRLPNLRSPMCMVDCSQIVADRRVGYRRKVNETGWECDEGYAGLVVESCFLEFDGTPCGTPTLLLSGCRPMVDCVAPMVDLCQFDVSECQQVTRGHACNITCRLPYTGMSTVASCEWNNTDALQGLQVDLPSCSFPTCPDPATLPLGYVRHANGSYGCDRDYIGTAMRRCGAFSPQALGNAAIGPTCYTEAVFSGCKVIAEIVACQAPVLDVCRQDGSTCSGAALEPGGVCEIGCLRPYYIGTASSASCPLDNINTTGGLEWTPPQCSLQCPTPTLAEEPAYGRNPEGGSSQDSSGWVCNPGYAGVPQVSCILLEPTMGARCGVARLQMSGCSRLEPCVPLLASSIDFQVRLPAPPPSRETMMATGEGFMLEVQCANLGPGEACLVGCRPPFMGPAVTATCPVGNTDRFQAPVLDQTPHCELVCPDPPRPPLGYRGSGREWQCTPDYTGQPIKYCNASAACNETAPMAMDDEGACANAVDLEISFSGCAKRQPCDGPEVQSCQVESDCPASLLPGQSCAVRCRFPFEGEAMLALCPRDNTLLNGAGLVLEPPICTLPECYDPLPPGYQLNSDGWTCSAGFFGTARRQCSTDQNCEREISLTGCQQLQPCQPPDHDRCRYDFSRCRSTLDGGACEIHCRAPYASRQVGQASCAAGNVDAQRLLDVIRLPECVPVCDEEVPGYEALPFPATGWRCADGYIGAASAVCTINEREGQCVAELSISGCLQRQPCKKPQADEGCTFEIRGCEEIFAGSSNCEIACKHPYSGNSSLASCPSNNTDRERLADLLLPQCVVKEPCPDPEGGIPAAYRYTGEVQRPVICAPGYHGEAMRQCAAQLLPNSSDTCEAVANFSGCDPLLPCVAPNILPTDCALAHDCPDELAPGSSCSVSCKKPLVGVTSTVSCPSSNTLVGKEADWIAPQCSCPDPELVPPGFQPAVGDWNCLAGYVGTARKLCPCNGEVSLLTGCYAPIICGAAGLADTDARKGYVGGSLKFGPSTVDGRADEDGVFRYQVFWADDCGAPMGKPFLSLPRSGAGLGPSQCCKTDVYSVQVEPMAVPPGATNLLIQVLTSSGAAPDGLVVPLVDESFEDTVTDAPKGTVGHARCARVGMLWLLLGWWIVRQSSESFS